MNRRLDALQDRTGVGQVLLDGSDFGNGKRAVGEVHAGQQLFDIEVHQRALRGTVDFGQGVGRGVGGRIQHAAHRLHVRTVIQHVFGGLP